MKQLKQLLEQQIKQAVMYGDFWYWKCYDLNNAHPNAETTKSTHGKICGYEVKGSNSMSLKHNRSRSNWFNEDVRGRWMGESCAVLPNSFYPAQATICISALLWNEAYHKNGNTDLINVRWSSMRDKQWGIVLQQETTLKRLKMSQYELKVYNSITKRNGIFTQQE